MEKVTLDTIKTIQQSYFNTVKGTDIYGNEIKNSKYNQILESEKLGYWVDVYDGPSGSGFITREKKTELGKTYIRSYHTGPETYRNEKDGEWVETS